MIITASLGRPFSFLHALQKHRHPAITLCSILVHKLTPCPHLLPNLGQVKRFIQTFWSEVAQIQAFIGKFRFFSELWFVSCIFLPRVSHQRNHPASGPGQSSAGQAPKEVNDAL
ncbi:hypothetical protein DM807_03105 [Pseudomonas hunanensis]|nr:hypothetical protein [Pseudomonas hunanensis]